MESSSQSGNNSDSPYHRWSGILGTIVAVLTLTVPLLMIGYYSPFTTNAEPLPEQIYSLPPRGN
ncbi:hypothetical protein IQ238_15760 [Pleurocapsales cyanobacterium LEGE 06147]|nr:hypothetical protein [Pleurocapsales cyanobacterium LEGE 06147]